MTLAVDEFLRRFLLHLLPPGFVRIRNFGFLANRNRATLLPLCFQLLGGSREDDCFGGITVHRSDSLTLELPSLRRNHARRRTALRRATPASLATSTRPVRRMKLVSTSSASARASARTQIPCLIWPKPLACQSLQRSTSALGDAIAPLHPAFKPSDPTQLSLPS